MEVHAGAEVEDGWMFAWDWVEVAIATVIDSTNGLGDGGKGIWVSIH